MHGTETLELPHTSSVDVPHRPPFLALRQQCRVEPCSNERQHGPSRWADAIIDAEDSQALGMSGGSALGAS